MRTRRDSTPTRMMQVTDLADVRVGDHVTCQFQSNGRNPVAIEGIAEDDGAGAIVVGPATVRTAARNTPAYTKIISIERPIELPADPWALIATDDDDTAPRFALLRPSNATGISWVDDHGIPLEIADVEQLLINQTHRIVFHGDPDTGVAR